MKRLAACLVAVSMLLPVSLARGDDAALLAGIQKQLQAQLATSFSFEQQRHLAVLTRPVVSSGRLEFSEDKGLCWNIRKPYTTTLLVNDAGIYQVQAGQANQQLMASGNPVFETFANVYMALFKGEMGKLGQAFALQPQRDGDNWSIRLVPLPDSPLVWLQQIEISQQGGVNQLSLQEKNGDHTDIRFEPVVASANNAETQDAGTVETCW